MVHKNPMKNVDVEIYLGEILHKNTKLHATIVERKAKAHGILANIKTIITDIPLGHRRFEIGLQLHQAGILYNSETWPKITKTDLEDLCEIDRHLLRFILGAYPKSASEQLYLESASLDISHIIISLRLIYLKTLVNRTPNELTTP